MGTAAAILAIGLMVPSLHGARRDADNPTGLRQARARRLR